MGVKAKTSLQAKQTEAKLGQKFGIIGDELNYTLTPIPVKKQEKGAVGEGEDLMITLQKIYDLVEVEAGMNRDIKDKIARVLANYYHQEEPGFTAEEAYKSIIRDYQMVRDIPERSKPKPRKRQSANPSSISMPARPIPKAPSSQEPQAPSLSEIMAGRPFSPADFLRDAQPVTRTRLPRTLPQQAPPAMRPAPQSQFGMRPAVPRTGPMPGPFRGMGFGFRFMGFPMMPGRPW